MLQRHNEVRDAIEDLVAIARSQMKREPITREADEENHLPMLIADLTLPGVCLIVGLWYHNFTSKSHETDAFILCFAEFFCLVALLFCLVFLCTVREVNYVFVHAYIMFCCSAHLV